MNYTEKYELRQLGKFRSHTLLGEFDREHTAVEAMEELASKGSGVWHVVRVSSVIVASVAKA